MRVSNPPNFDHIIASDGTSQRLIKIALGNTNIGGGIVNIVTLATLGVDLRPGIVIAVTGSNGGNFTNLMACGIIDTGILYRPDILIRNTGNFEIRMQDNLGAIKPNATVIVNMVIWALLP